VAERAPGRAAPALVALAAGAATALGAVLPAHAAAAPAPLPSPGPTAAPPDAHAPGDAPAPDDAPDEVRVEITELRSTPLGPDDVLSVGVRVVNGTDEPVEGLTAELRLQREVLATRSAVAAWSTAPADAAAGAVLLGAPLRRPLAPGTARELVLSAPADELGLPDPTSGWGPRGVAVDVVDAAGSRLDADRGLVVWYPAAGDDDPGADLPGADDPVRVSVVLPLTGAAPDVATGLVPDAAMARLVDGDEPGSGEGRLGRLLAVADRPGTTWALDPLLLDSSEPAPVPPAPPEPAAAPPALDRAAGTPPEPDGATTPPAAPAGGAGTAAAAPTEGVATWRADLLGAAPGHEVLALPRGDTDLLSVSAAERPALWTDGLRQAAASLERAGLPLAAPGADAGVRADVVWPARGELDRAAADLAARGGARGVVVAEDLLSGGVPDAAPAPPVDGVVPLPGRPASGDGAGGEDLSGLVVDERLSAVLAAAGAPTGGRAPAEPPELVVPRLLAETAALALEEQDDEAAPHALVVAPRSWDVGVAEGSAALEALTGAPWTTPAPVSALLEEDGAQGPPAALPPAADGAPPAPLDAGVLAAAADAVDRAEELRGTLSDASPLAAARLRAVAAAALSQRAVDGWAEQVSAVVADATALAGSVRLLQGGTVTVVGAEASVPVTVANDLEQAVEVVVAARAASPRVRVLDDVTTTVAAGSRSQVQVPVEAVGGGDTELRLQLRTPDGAALGQVVTVPVQVRLEWAEWGTAGIAALGGLVLVAGLVRSVRRVRSRPPGTGPRAPGAAGGSAPARPPRGGAPPARPGAAPRRPPPGDRWSTRRSPQTSPQPQGGAARTGTPAEEIR